jgi:hypothetical protein
VKQPYTRTTGPSFAFHAPTWHPDCPVSVVDVGGRPHLWCPECRCLVYIEAVAVKAEIAATFAEAKEMPL